MTLLVAPLLFFLLGVGAVKAKKAGLSGWEVVLMSPSAACAFSW